MPVNVTDCNSDYTVSGVGADVGPAYLVFRIIGIPLTSCRQKYVLCYQILTDVLKKTNKRLSMKVKSVNIMRRK